MRLVNLAKSTWPKIGLNMTKIDEPYLFEHDRKVTTSNLNRWIWPKIEKKNWSYSPVNVRRCDDIYFIFNFWLYSTVKVCRCGNIHYIFGHVHKFRSYSFGHLYSVMLITLHYFCKTWINKKMISLGFSEKYPKRLVKISLRIVLGGLSDNV